MRMLRIQSSRRLKPGHHISGRNPGAGTTCGWLHLISTGSAAGLHRQLVAWVKTSRRLQRALRKGGRAGMTQLVRGDMGELRAVIDGPVLEPGDLGFEDARRAWNSGIDRRPAVIARCTSAG